jgi:IclR family transcriptional regulator, acetate operon repressor
MSKIVDRTLDVLELFADEKRPLTLSDIARLLSIPLSSCHDVVQAMQSRGYLYELAPRAGYYPTLRLQGLGRDIGDNDPVVARARLLLRPLRDKLDESVLLVKASQLQGVYLLAFESTHPLRYQARIGDRIRGLHSTSAGKALLADLDERELSAYLKTAKLVAVTKRTITSAAALRKDLDISRAKGWFINRGESLDGVTTVSAPFHWNEALYIVTIAGPSNRIDLRLDIAIDVLTNVCRRLELQDEGGRRSNRKLRAS